MQLAESPTIAEMQKHLKCFNMATMLIELHDPDISPDYSAFLERVKAHKETTEATAIYKATVELDRLLGHNMDKVAWGDRICEKERQWFLSQGISLEEYLDSATHLIVLPDNAGNPLD